MKKKYGYQIIGLTLAAIASSYIPLPEMVSTIILASIATPMILYMDRKEFHSFCVKFCVKEFR